MENITTEQRIERLKELWEEDNSTIEETVLMAELCMEWGVNWRKYMDAKAQDGGNGAMFAALQDYSNRIYQETQGIKNPLEW